MNPISWLFGSWKLTCVGTATVVYQSPLAGKTWDEQVGVTIERHTRTNKERAFLHKIDGTKCKTSVELVQCLIRKKEGAQL